MENNAKEGVDLALAYAAAGYPVFPVRTENKMPWTTHGFKDASTDPEVIARWWKQRPTARVGVSVGDADVVVVDLDVKGGVDGPGNWDRASEGLSSPWEVPTPSGGKHLWFRNDGAWTTHNGFVPGVDIKTVGGYVVAYGPPPDIELPVLPLIGNREAQKPAKESIDTGDLPLSWDEILSPHGYERCGATSWVRPGKDCRDGISMAIIPELPHLIKCFSGSDELLGTEAYSKERLFQTLNPGAPLPAPKTLPGNWGQKLDWQELLTGEIPEPDWIVEPLLERGHQIAVYSQPKTGKSLLMLDMVAGLAAGRPVLGNPAREPTSVVYVDQENGRGDIREHLTNMGYKPDELVNLHYYSFPSLAMLDTEKGGQELHAVAKYHDAELVVIDTLSRVVEGRENENDTYHNLYRNTGVRLKADGIAVIRLDHAGKEDDRGMRGASAKASDVDSVWWLASVGKDQLVLTRTHQRMSHGASRVQITRADNPLRHTVEDWLDQQMKDPVADIVTQLDLDEVPVTTGWNQAYDKYKHNQHNWTQSMFKEATKRRKNQLGGTR